MVAALDLGSSGVSRGGSSPPIRTQNERMSAWMSFFLDPVLAYHTNDPGIGMALSKDTGRFKMYASDTGLFTTLAFKDKDVTENILYSQLLSDKLSASLGV